MIIFENPDKSRRLLHNWGFFWIMFICYKMITIDLSKGNGQNEHISTCCPLGYFREY